MKRVLAIFTVGFLVSVALGGWACSKSAQAASKPAKVMPQVKCSEEDLSSKNNFYNNCLETSVPGEKSSEKFLRIKKRRVRKAFA